MKKNSFVFLLFILFFPLFNISAMEVSYKLDDSNLLICSIRTPPVKAGSILDSMEIGHRAEIEFIIKVYQNKKRFLSFLGDRLEKDNSVSYVATRDPVNRIFKIVKSDGQKLRKEDEKSFFDTFFSADDIRIDMSRAEKGEYYILSRIEMKVIKLIPPLNLLSDIIPGIITKTDWIKVGTFRIN
ncbi:MAG: hypothetical protein FWF38_01440 [Spirochaetaceae bacterium]|nr:hypothetical protein [Spirochaetaceae bacterium]